jgi:hypothetical protein
MPSNESFHIDEIKFAMERKIDRPIFFWRSRRKQIYDTASDYTTSQIPTANVFINDVHTS